MRKAVSREIGRSQKDPAERFDWVDVYLMVGSSVLGAGRIYYYLLGGKHTRVMIMIMWKRDYWVGMDSKEGRRGNIYQVVYN